MLGTVMEEEEVEIAIIGGGICGLATALALHRKGIGSVVFERSSSIRAAGAAIGILTNGWLALNQLSVADLLRRVSIPLHLGRDVLLEDGNQHESPLSVGEARCLKRSDLINVLADSLPEGTIRLGRHLISLKTDPLCSFPILRFHDGSVINAKVVIGCEGANSVVGDFLGLKPPELFSLWVTRGFTHYPNDHPFGHDVVRLRDRGMVMGRIPITSNLVHWFLTHQSSSKGSNLSKDPELIRQLTLGLINNFPTEMAEMVQNSDPESLSLTQLRYRAPWDVFLSRFSKGNVTVAGDAMHVMGPFIGQGGSAGLEDAIVLARCLVRKLPYGAKHAGEAFDEYVKERRMRIARLSTQSYLIGLLIQSSSSFVKFVCAMLMKVLFRNPNAHTRYDCGLL